MSDPTEARPYRELDDDERHYATASIEEIRRELEHYGVRTAPAMAAVRALIERTPRAQTASAAETTYLQHLAAIERIAAYTARRSHLTADETAEFVQFVRVKLFENDYEIIRKFEDRSSFTTYVTTVIVRLFQQWRAGQWGKWRPSAQARALGEPAIALERLLSRDGFSFPEAVATLTQGLPQHVSVRDLEAIYAQLPHRNVPAEESVRAGEREITLRAAAACLHRVIGDSSPEDRLILQLRFWNGSTAPEIARIVGLEPRKIYKRLGRSFRALQRALDDAGIDHAVIGELLDRPALDRSLKPRPERTSADRNRR